MLQSILTLIAKDKGRDVNRTLVLVLIGFCTWQNHEMQKDVAAVKTELAVLSSRIALVATNAENKLASYHAR